MALASANVKFLARLYKEIYCSNLGRPRPNCRSHSHHAALKFYMQGLSKVQQPLIRKSSYFDHSGRSGLSFYDAWPQGLCPGMVLVVKI